MFLGWTLGVLLAAPVARVEASCGYGTILQPREDGAVKVNKFGYFGATVPSSLPAFWLQKTPVEKEKEKKKKKKKNGGGKGRKR